MAKTVVIIIGLFFCLSAYGQAPVISPSVPVVNQGGTLNFSCTSNCGTGGSWSCSGCAGSINSGTGVYTAPSSVMNKQSCGGYQCLPNNHIFNERIDSLSVNSNSANWIAASGSSQVSYGPTVPINYCDGSTPTQSQVFYYTTANNGSFQIPAYPFARIEQGWASAHGITGVNGGVPYVPFTVDHHFVCMDTTNGTIQEMYQFYPAGTATGIESCPTCTSQSGQRYLTFGYALPANGSTNAGGTDLWPLMLRLQELEQAVANSGTINHALLFTLPAGSIANSTFIWPATAGSSGSGSIPYGARARLKSTFNVSGFTYSGCTGTCLAAAKIILTQLQQYGLILSDIGGGWQVDLEDTRLPLAYAQAFSAIFYSTITPSNFEFVDESRLWRLRLLLGKRTLVGRPSVTRQALAHPLWT